MVSGFGSNIGSSRRAARKGAARVQERALYCARLRGEEESEEGANATCPSGFIVLAAFDALVVQVFFEAPALLQQHITELLHVLDNTRAFLCADIEPDAGTRLGAGGRREFVHDALIPPNRRRKSGNAAEDIGALETKVERDETTERGAAEAGVGRTGKRAVFALDEGHNFFNEESGVAVGAASAEPGHARGCVFADARFRVVQAHDDERFNRAAADAFVGGVAVVQIEHGKAPPSLVIVAGRKIDDEVALVAQEPGAKLFVLAQLTGAHGAMVTSKSLASTCWPGDASTLVTRPAIGA